MVRWLRWHCPPDTGFEIRALAVWGRARYLSVTEAPHNTDFHKWIGKKHFLLFQTAETGNRTPNSGVKGSGANHYPRAPAPSQYTLIGYEVLHTLRANTRRRPYIDSISDRRRNRWASISTSGQLIKCLVLSWVKSPDSHLHELYRSRFKLNTIYVTQVCKFIKSCGRCHFFIKLKVRVQIYIHYYFFFFFSLGGGENNN